MPSKLTAVALARHLSPRAVALLGVIANSEKAPLKYRVPAALSIIAIAHGRPGTAKPVTVDDIRHLDARQHEALFVAQMEALEQDMPGTFETFVGKLAASLPAAGEPAPEPRFVRGSKKPPPPWEPPPRGATRAPGPLVQPPKPDGAPSSAPPWNGHSPAPPVPAKPQSWHWDAATQSMVPDD